MFQLLPELPCALRQLALLLSLMSTGPQTQDGIAAMLGDAPAAHEPRMQALRDAGLTPTARRGGGRNAIHFEAEHFTRVVFSLAALKPRDIPEAVKALELLPYRGSIPSNTACPGHSLGLALTAMLDMLAEPFSRGEHLTAESAAMVDSWQMLLCLNPLEARISMDDGEGLVTYYFAADNPSTPPVQRLTMVSGAVWLSISKLLADSYINKNAIAAIQFLDRTRPAKAKVQEQKSAGNLRQEAPAPISDQPRANETGGFHALPEAIREDRDFQGKPRRRQVTSSRKKKEQTDA